MTTLSIVIPTYQREQLVAASLRAYLLHLIPPAEAVGIKLEVIVVDDNSTDRTFQTLEEHFSSVSGIKLLQLQANSGPGRARDAGVDLATGHWIWFLDDDDELDPDGLTSLFESLVRNKQGPEVIAHSLKREYTGSMTSNRGRMASRIATFREHQEVFRYVIRRDLLLRHSIRFSVGLHEDVRYVFEVIARSSGVIVIPERIVIKRTTPDAITANMSEARIDGYIRTYNEIVKLLALGDFGVTTTRREVLDQTLGVILYLVVGVTDANRALMLLQYLDSVSRNVDDWSADLRGAPTYSPTDTNFEYAGSLWRQRKVCKTFLPDCRDGTIAT